ncbi:MAG: COX15/CtaA family protein, partial [Solirubrobacteraceae bacterium]
HLNSYARPRTSRYLHELAPPPRRQRPTRIRALRVPERLYGHLTLLLGACVVLLIGTGGWVRLSESGLGCPTWPSCYVHRLAAQDSYHAMVEFANRCMITAVGILAIAALTGALLRRERRADLVWLSLGLVVGYVGEAILGGITVLLKLAPALVAAHLVLAMLLLLDAVVLHWRAGEGATREQADGPSTAVPVAGVHVRRLGRLMFAAIGLVVVLGTVATGSGPRAGSPDTPRFHFRFSATVELHAVVGMFLFGLVVAFYFLLRTIGLPRRVRATYTVVVATMALQGVLGYVQYFTNLRTGLVEAHILGAALLIIAVVRLNLELGPPRIERTASARKHAEGSRRFALAPRSAPKAAG